MSDWVIWFPNFVWIWCYRDFFHSISQISLLFFVLLHICEENQISCAFLHKLLLLHVCSEECTLQCEICGCNWLFPGECVLNCFSYCNNWIKNLCNRKTQKLQLGRHLVHVIQTGSINDVFLSIPQVVCGEHIFIYRFAVGNLVTQRRSLELPLWNSIRRWSVDKRWRYLDYKRRKQDVMAYKDVCRISTLANSSLSKFINTSTIYDIKTKRKANFA